MHRTVVVGSTLLGLGTAAGLALALTPSPAPPPVPYPDGYRDWQHVKSMVIQPGHPLADPFEGLHHVYANERAAAGLASTNYADGAVFVFDLREALAAGNAITAGPRKLVGIMRRDAVAYEATGGWGFEGFAKDSKTDRLVKDGGKSCFDCHAARPEQSYVFSERE